MSNKYTWTSNNVNLTLYDKKPLWDNGDGFTRYMEDETTSRYNLSISCINAKTETRNLSCYLSKEARYLKKRDAVVKASEENPEYADWWDNTFNVWAKSLKDQVEGHNMEFIHPVLFGIPTLKKQAGRKGPSQYMGTPNVVAAFRYRIGNDPTQHYWKIVWRYYDPQDQKTYTLAFDIDNKTKTVTERSGDVSRRVGIPEIIHFPGELFQTAGYDAGTESHKKKVDEEINLHKEFMRKQKRQAKNYQSKFTKKDNTERDNVKNIAIQWSSGRIVLPDADIESLASDLLKHNITSEELGIAS